MKFLSLILLFAVSGAQADILFLDLNNSPLEVKAAQRAARKRGERLIVYPQIDKDQQALINSYRQRLDALRRDYDAATDNTTRDRIRTEYYTLDDERRAKVQGVTFKPDDLRRVLGEMSADGTKLSSVIISGHDGNNDFTGSQGYMDARSFTEAFAEHPEIADGIESLFLAGCYTVKPGTLEYQFQGTFKNLKAIAGYDDSAPAGDKPAGHAFIENFLTREGNLEGLEGESAVRREIRKIIPRELSTNASLCLPGAIYVERDVYMDMSEAWAKCDENAEIIKAGADMFNCYANAGGRDRGYGAYIDPYYRQQNRSELETPRGDSMGVTDRAAEPEPLLKCENPPEDTHHSELRDYYNALQNIAPCKHKPGFDWHDFPDPERVIRLIYHKKVALAFTRAYASDLKDSVQILIDAGVPREVAEKITKLAEMSREEALDYIAMLESNYGYDRNSTGDEKTDKARLALASITQGIKAHIGNLDPRCVPFDWVDTGNQKSLCASDTHIGSKAMARAESKYERVKIRDEIERLYRERENLRYGDTYNYGSPQDPVVSDSAVERTIMQGQGRTYDLRIGILDDQSRILEYQDAIASSPDTQDGRAMREAYERELEELRRRKQEKERQLATLAPAVDIETLRQDRRAFFQAAVNAAQANPQDLTSQRREVESYDEIIRDYRQRMEGVTDTYMLERYRSRIERYEAARKEMQDQITEREQHVEYIREMAALLESEGPNPESQERIAAIVQARVQALRDQRVAVMNAQISYLQKEVDWCNNRPGRCQANDVSSINEQMNLYRQQIRAIEVGNDTGDF